MLLRLPHELKEIMRDWLSENYPDKLKHVFSLVGDTRGGKDLRFRLGHSARPASAPTPG